MHIYILRIFCYQGGQANSNYMKGVEIVELTTGYEFNFPPFNVIQAWIYMLDSKDG